MVWAQILVSKGVSLRLNLDSSIFEGFCQASNQLGASAWSPWTMMRVLSGHPTLALGGKVTRPCRHRRKLWGWRST